MIIEWSKELPFYVFLGLYPSFQYRKFRRAAAGSRSLSALSGPETPFASQDFDVRGRNRNKLYNTKKERMQKSKKKLKKLEKI